MVAFTQEFECEYCAETQQLVEDVAALSDLIEVEVYDFVADAEKAEELGVDKVPAIAVIGAEDYGVRFYGIPAGYEFVSLLHSLSFSPVVLKTLSWGFAHVVVASKPAPPAAAAEDVDEEDEDEERED
jgi:hypothetical protein